MLGKMFKYDFKDYSKNMLPFCLLLLAMSIMTRIFFTLSSNFEKLSTVFNILFGISTMILVITIVVSFVYCFFISIKHFYKKVLKDEGYLTHTLPIKKSSIINSQLLSSTLWLIIICIVTILALTIAFYQKGMLDNFWQAFTAELNSEIIISPIATLIIIAAMILVSYIGTILAIYASMAIGHGFSNNKIGYSIVAGVIFYVAFQILSIIILVGIFAFNYNELMEIYNNSAELSASILKQIIAEGFIVNFIILAVSYILTNYNLKKRLNLE